MEPYYGGSHRAFLDGWRERSRHDWTLLTLPARKWKWRMRQAAISFADEAALRAGAGERWDVLFCSDMLNLAEFLGLAPETVRRLRSVAYFHENQLTYPYRFESDRDCQFGMTNLTTALAATAVWFNSGFHRDSLVGAAPKFLKRMPDRRPTEIVERIRAKSSIHPIGIGDFPARVARRGGPMRVLWAGRWEHDKDPETFFAALESLEARGVAFRMSVLGEEFRESPAVFAWAREHFAGSIDRWGYQETRGEYESALADADVIVSTARHEFFGISVVEAIAAGSYPLLPRRLSYPEILGADEESRSDGFFYGGDSAGLADALAALARRVEAADLWRGDPERARRLVSRFSWATVAPALDAALAAAGAST